MDSITILRSIVADGCLTETNMQKARELLDIVDQVNASKDLKAILEECRAEAQRGNAVAAVKKYRAASGCGLREAHDAVTGGARFG